MTNIYFRYGKVNFIEGRGEVDTPDSSFLGLHDDAFFLFGDASEIRYINAFRSSLDVKNAKMNNRLFLELYTSKAENINANKIRLCDGSSLLNSSTNQLEARGNNTIDGIVSARTVTFYNDCTLSIAKNGVLKVPDKNALDFSKISGEGKVFDEKTKAYYDTSGNALNNAGNSFQENIVEYNAKIADAIEKVKAQKYSYVDKAQQEQNVELLNIEAVSNDALI